MGHDSQHEAPQFVSLNTEASRHTVVVSSSDAIGVEISFVRRYLCSGGQQGYERSVAHEAMTA